MQEDYGMNMRNLYIILGLTISLIPFVTLQPAALAPSAKSAMQEPFPEITEEDLRKAEEEIEAFRASLSEEERKKFDQDVQEFTKALESMSEQELQEFFNQLATLDENMLPKIPEEPRPAPTPAPSLPQPEPAKIAPVKKGDTRPAEQLIDDIVKHINNFTVKVSAITDIDQKFKSWQTKGKLVTNKSINEWGHLVSAVEQFKQQLLKLKDKDPKTREFRYLNDLIEDKKLYEDLSILKGELATYEQNIILPSAPGAHQISSNNRTFIIKVIETIFRALQTQKIDEQINAIFAKYEPVAKTLKKAEEQREKRALEAGRRSPQPEPARVYGRTPTPPTPYQRPTGGNGGYSSMGGSYVPAPTTAPHTARGFGSPTSEESQSTPSQEVPSRIGTSTGMPKSDAPASATKKQEEDAALSAAPEDMTPEMKRSVRTMTQLVEKVDDLVEQHILPILQSDVHQNLNKELSAQTPTLVTVKRVAQLGKDLDRLKEHLQKINAGITKQPHSALVEYQEAFKEWHKIFATDTKNIFDALRAVKDPKDYNADIKFAYFADTSLDRTTLTPEVSTIKDPANIPALKKKIEEIVTMLQALMAIKKS